MFVTKSIVGIAVFVILIMMCRLQGCDSKKVHAIMRRPKSSSHISATFKMAPELRKHAKNIKNLKHSNKRNARINTYNGFSTRGPLKATTFLPEFMTTAASSSILPSWYLPMSTMSSNYPQWYTLPISAVGASSSIRKFDMPTLMSTPIYTPSSVRRSDNLISPSYLDLDSLDNGRMFKNRNILPISNYDYVPWDLFSGNVNANERMDNVLLPTNVYDGNLYLL